MKTKNMAKLAAAVLAIAVLMGQAAFAQPEEGQGCPPCEERGKGNWQRGDFQKMKDDFIEKLGLNPEQQEALKANREKQREEGRAIMQSLKDKRKALRDELDKYVSDEKAVKSLASEIKALEAQAVDHRIAGVLAVKKILTAEQYAKFVELRKEHMQKFKGHRKGFRKMGPSPENKGQGEGGEF